MPLERAPKSFFERARRQPGRYEPQKHWALALRDVPRPDRSLQTSFFAAIGIRRP